MTGRTQEELQPRGNAAAQQQLPQSQFGDSLFDFTPLGLGMHLGEQLANEGMRAWNDFVAQQWWVEYKAAAESHRAEMALQAWRDGVLTQHVRALSNEQAVDDAHFRDELGEVLDYLQQLEMMQAAGMTWEEMASTQGQHMLAEARAAAAAASPDSGPVSDADLQAAHQDSVADQDYLGEEDTSWWDSLTPAMQARWNQRGADAIRAWVAHAQGAHPDMAVQASEIGVDIPGNSNSVAYVDGRGKCWIGKTTIEAIERNPAYADSTIMHEIRGHPEFDTGFALSMELYDAAAPSLPGYTRPAQGSDERDDEWTRFEYFESEIGALMREESFWVDSQDLDGDGTIEASERNELGSPEDLLHDLLSNLAGQFAPQLQGPFVTGLARRFEADPRVTPAASELFARTCEQILGTRP